MAQTATVKDKYAVDVNVVNAEGAARLRQNVVHVMVEVLLMVVVLMHLENADLTPARHVAAVEEADLETRYPVPDVLEMERSTYGKLVQLVVDVALLPADRKRPALCVMVKVISSASIAMDAVLPTGRSKESRWVFHEYEGDFT